MFKTAPPLSVYLMPRRDSFRSGTASPQDESLFLSQAWYRACVDSWTRRANFHQMPVGTSADDPAFALIGERLEIRHGLLPVRVLALNQTGRPMLDQPWIERNGFFCASPAQFSTHLSILLDKLMARRNWDELRIGGLVDERAHEALYLAARKGLNARLEIEQPSFAVDLDEIRSRHAGDYLAALSPNTRQQLRRAQRAAEKVLGPLTLDIASSLDEALEWFDATGPLHKARWHDAESQVDDSGFNNPDFVDFHRRLITHAFAANGIQYLRLKAGDATLAYLYNFVSGRDVHFYLSGIDYTVGEQFRPGMLAHWMAIELNLTANRRSYDFLAGDARYKRSLSTRQDCTLWLVLQRPRWRLQAESFGRRWKRKLTGAPMDDLATTSREVRFR